MSFVDHRAANLKSRLLSAHYAFPRGDELRQAFCWMMTDYYSKLEAGTRFEANGIMVTGPSRTGKTKEIEKLLSEFNKGDTLLPDGRPAKFASVMLRGEETRKGLVVSILRNGLGFRTHRKTMTQAETWDFIVYQAREQGVVGIHLDECQHIFPKTSSTGRAIILDNFKSFLKQPDWPMMLIISGIDELAQHVSTEEQLAHLLKPVGFPEIQIQRSQDQNEIHMLCHAYAERGDVDFSAFSTIDFYQRLTCACAQRWGLAIEMLIGAICMAHDDSTRCLRPKHFSAEFSRRTGLQPGYSPFEIDDYEQLFQSQKILELWLQRGSERAS